MLRLAMKSERLNTALRTLLTKTVECVRDLETRFAVDSSFYKTPNSMIQIQHRGGGLMALEKVRNAKLHIAVGLRSLIVVAAQVSDDDAHDSPYFRKLLTMFNKRFRIDEVMADAAYDAPQNYAAVAACGATAYIDIKAGAKVGSSPERDAAIRLRETAEGRDAWEEHYRFRSLVECVNSSMKRTIKRAIRACLAQSRENEMLLLVLVYNLLRLMEARIEFGIEIEWADPEALRRLDAIALKHASNEAA